MDMKEHFNIDYKKGVILVMLTAVVSGFSIFINSIGIKEFDSSVFTFLKNAAVAAMLFAVILGFSMFSELRALKKKQWLQLIIIGLVGGSIPFLLYFKGLQMTTGATSGFLHKTLFIYASVFAVIFLREKITKGLAIGAAMLLLGNYLLIKPDFGFSAGHILVAIAVIFWAAENTFAKQVLKNVSGTVVAFGRMFFGSLFIFAFLASTGKISFALYLTHVHYLWIGLTSIFLLLYNTLFYNGLRHMKVSTAACILSLGQPITTALSFIFKSKAVGLGQGFGMLLIVAGVISVLWLSSIISLVRQAARVRQYGRH